MGMSALQRRRYSEKALEGISGVQIGPFGSLWISGSGRVSWVSDRLLMARRTRASLRTPLQDRSAAFFSFLVVVGYLGKLRSDALNQVQAWAISDSVALRVWILEELELGPIPHAHRTRHPIYTLSEDWILVILSSLDVSCDLRELG